MKEILKYLKGTFNKREKHPIEKGIYVILGGTYSAEFFVYFSQDLTHITFFSLPDKKVRKVPKESFYNGIKNKLVEFIERLPDKVYKTVEHEFNLINNNTNGFCKPN